MNQDIEKEKKSIDNQTSMDDEFKKHIEKEDKKITISNKEYTYKSLYDGFMRKTLNIEGCYFGYSSCYFLETPNEDFFFSEQLKEFKLINLKDNSDLISQNICCSDEIKKLLSNYENNKILFKNKVYNKQLNFSIFDSKEKTIIFFYNDENLSELNFNENFQLYREKSEFNPNESSPYFFIYFPGNEKQGNVIYRDSIQRRKLSFILNDFNFKSDIRLFKFTGPCGIGKSFLLFIYSRTTFNRIYINLKVLNDLKNLNQITKLKNILISELNRLKNVDEKEKNELNNILNNKFEIESLVIGIIKSLKDNKSVIILDQFKFKYFNNFNEVEDLLIKSNSKLKLIICSSIDDKIGRNSIDFISSLIFSKNEDIYNPINIQKKFFYISELLETNDKELLFNNLNNNNNKLLNYALNNFNYVPKYVSKILNNENILDEMFNIKKRIKEKIKNYYQFNTEEELSFQLVNIQKYMYSKLEINDLNEISQLFPLKYFIVKFYSNNKEIYFVNENNINEINFFDIEINFKFMTEILNEYNNDLQQEFFLQKHYKFHSGFTIGGYFEFIAVDKIKKGILKLPETPDITLRLKCICNMNEVDMEINDFSSNAKLQNLVFNQKKSYTKEILFKIKNNYNINTSLPLLEKDFNEFFACEGGFEEEKKNFLLNNTVSIYYIDNKTINNYIKVNTEQKKNIEIYLEVKNKEIYNNLRDTNIILTQSQQNAPVYDAGYIYGKSFKKIFIGFQMKSLRDTPSKTLAKINKKYVIDNSIQLLFTSKLLFDVEIVEWHYIVVGILFESEDKIFAEEKKYSEKLREHCENNDIRFIYYNPFNQKFFDSNKSAIKNLLNEKSNLFNNYNQLHYFQFNLIDIPIITNETKFSYFIEFIKDMYVNKETINTNIDKGNCMQEIKTFKNIICERLEIKSIKFKTKRNFDNFLTLPDPGNMFLFFFKKKNISEEQFSYYAFFRRRKNMRPELFTCEKKGETITEIYDYCYFNYFDLTFPFIIFILDP